MQTEKSTPETKTRSAVESAALFAVGDRLEMLVTLSDPAGDIPAQHYCNAGDEVEVRQVGGCGFTLYVAHPHMPEGKMFGINVNECRKLSANNPDIQQD